MYINRGFRAPSDTSASTAEVQNNATPIFLVACELLQRAIREIVDEAVCDRTGLMSAFGEPEHAGIAICIKLTQAYISAF